LIGNAEVQAEGVDVPIKLRANILAMQVSSMASAKATAPHGEAGAKDQATR